MLHGIASGLDPTTLVRLGGLALFGCSVWVLRKLHVGSMLARLVRRA